MALVSEKMYRLYEQIRLDFLDMMLNRPEEFHQLYLRWKRKKEIKERYVRSR